MSEIKTEKLRVGSGDLTATPYSTISSGTAAPNNANGSDGDVYIRIAGSNSDIYVKRSGSWLSVATSFANAELSNLAPTTAINSDLLFGSPFGLVDGTANIGASNSNRPSTIFVKDSINLDSLTANTLLKSNNSKEISSLANGADGQILTMASGLPSWQNPPSSGATGFNYISNPDAETNTNYWSTYADAAGSQPVDGTGGVPSVTWTRSTSNALRGVASFIFTKNGSNRQGEGVSTDFTIQNADLAKILTVTFDYDVTSGTYADGDLTIYLIQDPSGSPVVIQPSGYKILSASTGTKMRQIATFQTSSSATSYRLCFHVASINTPAYTVQIDNVVVSPQTVQYGAPVTDWNNSYIPTLSNGPTGVGNNVAYWRRIGDSIQASGKFTFTGSGPVSAFTLSLPAGLTIDSAKLSNLIYSDCGTCALFNEGYNYNSGVAIANTGGTSVNFLCSSLNNGNRLLGSNFNTTTTGSFTYFFEVPIQGWSSTVQMSNDTDTRVVAMFASKNGNLAIAANSTAVTSWTVVNDTHGTFNGVTGVYTIPVSGWYEFGGRYTLIGTSGYYGNLVNINGAGQEFIGNYVQSDRVGSSTIRYLLAGNTLIPGIYSSSIAGTLVSAACDFWVKRVSGPSAIAASESVNAKYTSTASTLIQNGVLIIVPFATKVYDSHGSFDGSTYTVPISGKYRITAAMHTNSLNVTSTHFISYSVYKNGSPDTQLFAWMAHANSPGPVNLIANGSTTVSCNAGDLLTIRAVGGNGINNATLSGSTVQNYMCIERVGN